MSGPPPMPRENVCSRVSSSLCAEMATHAAAPGRAHSALSMPHLPRLGLGLVCRTCPWPWPLGVRGTTAELRRAVHTDTASGVPTSPLWHPYGTLTAPLRYPYGVPHQTVPRKQPPYVMSSMYSASTTEHLPACRAAPASARLPVKALEAVTATRAIESGKPIAPKMKRSSPAPFSQRPPPARSPPTPEQRMPPSPTHTWVHGESR